ncbi:ImmA/IrrE family metallo-endopeptidase [Aeoliella mucimassa]|uniref:IrrE N-terminal-like domain-containing protein n=1 Tax=Aeoliella mucimassa TaxID=2527972 RepID=A0A518AQP5_9BACT|nr:ImmA/IrrE family metallo-endopeptidase [Aeoliella mucimassa]QDU57052.1 hypothetical protein Pan181_32660 [Aeoliella mucimassa]
MFADIPYEDWSAALDSTVDELLWESGVCEPAVDAFLVAIRLGLVVTEDLLQSSRARLVRFSAQHQPPATDHTATTIVLGEEQRFERRQFAVAHELGEFAAERVFARLTIDPRTAPFGGREQVANLLAARLLLPARWFRKTALACDWDLLEIKRVFWTASHELIARRMLDMSPPVVISVFDQGHLSWRNSNSGVRPQALLDTEYDCWQRAHHLGEPARAEPHDSELTSCTSVRCWPIHEPDWRREIMRSEVEAWH